MSKFELVLRCRSCKYKYKRVIYCEPDEIDDEPNPPCPKCEKKARRTDVYEQATPALPHAGMAGVIEAASAPGIVGAPQVKAIDTAARIVMEDHHLTNLKDNVREGDIMAPSLPPAQQQQVDNFWSAPKAKVQTMADKKRQAQMKRIMAGAIAGKYRQSALDVKAVLPDARVAMRSVAKLPIN
jgi:hypothetical protein